MNYKDLESIIADTLLSYEQGWNEANAPANKIRLHLTVTKHKIEQEGKNRDVAYIRLEREYFEKVSEEEDGFEAKGAYVIYNSIYKFASKAEIMEPEKWRKVLYMNLLAALIGGGVEHAEMMNRIREINHRKEKKSEVLVEDKEEKIQVTSKMPEPLRPDEKEYKAWVDKNNEQAARTKK